MPTTLTTGAQSLITNAFGSTVGGQLINEAAQSPYLAGLLNAFAAKGGKFVFDDTSTNTEKGTFTSSDGVTITIDSAWEPGASGTLAESPLVFATTLGHELAHSDLPGGMPPGATSPSQAIANGESAEGVALSAEYIVATQLGTQMHSDPSNVLTPQLNQVAQQDGLNIKTLDWGTTAALSFTQPGTAAPKDGGVYVGALTPSNAPNLTYADYYADGWLIASCLTSPSVDWNALTPTQLTYTVNADGSTTVQGSVPLIPGALGSPDGTMTISGTFAPSGLPSNLTCSTSNGTLQQFSQTDTTNASGQVAISVTGTGAAVQASGATISLASSGANVSVVGNGDLINGSAGDVITLSHGGSGDTINVSNATINFDALAYGTLKVVGNGDVINAASGYNTVTVVGQGDSVAVAGSYSDTINLDSTLTGGQTAGGDTATGSALTVNVSGCGNTVAIPGTTVNLTSSGSEVTIGGVGAHVLGNNLNNEIVNLGGVSDVAGGFGTGATINISGTGTGPDFDQITLNYGTLTEGVDSQAILIGYSDTAYANTGCTLSVAGEAGGNDLIYGVAGDSIGLSSTAGHFDTVDANGASVLLGTNTQANVNGSGDTIGDATGSSLGVYGGGNVINGGTTEDIYLSGTNGNFDTVNASGDVGGVKVYNGQTSGIYLNTDTQANVYGNADSNYANTGDSLGAYGTDNAIYGGPDEQLTVGNTGTARGTYDAINVSGDVSSAKVADGAASGISIDSGSVAVVFGSSDSIWEGANVGSYLVGNNDNVTADENGAEVTAFGSSDTVDTYALPQGGTFDIESGYVGFDGYYVGSGGFYGYGFAGNRAATATLTGQNIGSIAQYDLGQGHLMAAIASEAGLNQARAAAAMVPQAPGAGAAVLERAKWDSQVITWSLADSPGTAAAPFSGYMGSSEEAAAQKALAAWAAASGLTFKQVADSSQADIRIGWGDFDTANTGVLGYTSVHAPGGSMAADTIIRLEDPSQNPLAADASGQLVYTGTDATLLQTLLHEIGHALGLGSNADPTSVMYYELTASNRTLDATDIAGIRSIYDSGHQARGPTLGASPHQLIQAMAGFEPRAGAQFTVSTVAREGFEHRPLLAVSH